MLILVSGATATPPREKGFSGHLIVPTQGNTAGSFPLVPGEWAMDNGAFHGFDPAAFMRMLEAYAPFQSFGCRFVVAPDRVGDAAETYRLWPFWSRVIRGLGWPVAFVAQDGLTPAITPRRFDALFIGGSTKFKESAQVRSLCAFAKARGIWIHWGRVNGQRRYELAMIAGADSIDGSGFSIAPRVNLEKAKSWERNIRAQPSLDL